MCSNKYIISLTTIPSRIYNIENTIKSLVEQTLKPERIILNIPKKYNFRFNLSIDDITIKKILNKYIDKLTINYIEHDYGPGTKLMGLIKNNVINYKSNSMYIVLVDDDHIYKPYMLECFDNYNKKNYNNKLKCSSFYCYNNNGITIGQGSDGFFIRLELLNQFENYYNIIKDNDYINYHDDYYISYYFYLKQIQIEYIKPPDNTLIYTKHINSDIDALLSIHNKNNRNNLNDKLNEILNKLNIEDKFNEIKNDLCYLYSFSNLESVYSLSFPRFKLYCEYYSYNFSFYHDNIETIYKPHWNKLLYAIKLLRENLNVKYFIWVDHDIIIKNFDIKLYDIIKYYNFENNKANFMMSKDPISGMTFNSGVCIFKNNLNSLETFNKMIDMRNNPNNYPLFDKYYGYNFHNKGSLQDTRTFLLHFHENPEDLLSVPHRVLQSFYPAGNQYKLGDFCGHVAGPQGKELIQYMNNLINYNNIKIIKNHITNNFLKIPINNIYSSEIEQRWSNHEYNTNKIIINLIDNIKTKKQIYIFDAGSHVGDTLFMISIYLSNKKLENVKVIGVEPDLKKIKFINYIIKLNNIKNIIIHHNAISNSSGSYSISTENSNSGAWTINELNIINDNKLVSIDELCYNKKIYLMHLDIEGYELKALMSGERTIKTTEHFIIEWEMVCIKNLKKILHPDQFRYNFIAQEGDVYIKNLFINYDNIKETEIQNEIIEIKTNTGLDSETNNINKTNCEVITTTLSNKLSELRKENIINNLEKKYEFNINFIEGIKYDNWGKNEQYESTLNMLMRFEKSNYEYGIICQDDFYPIDNFLHELNKTIELLPDNWECLHLCPGFLWGRKIRDKSKIGQYYPEYNMNKTIFNYHESERFFINCDPNTYYNHNMWLGGPVAFIIKHTCITQFINKYKQNFDHDDRSLVRILNNNTFICRNPQLGYEEECKFY